VTLKNPLNIPGSGFGGGWLSQFNKYFLEHRYIRSKTSVKIRSAVLRKVANRHDRQTDKQTRTLQRPWWSQWMNEQTNGRCDRSIHRARSQHFEEKYNVTMVYLFIYLSWIRTLGTHEKIRKNITKEFKIKTIKQRGTYTRLILSLVQT